MRKDENQSETGVMQENKGNNLGNRNMRKRKITEQRKAEGGSYYNQTSMDS